jgi:hypothetical protein
VTTQKKEIGDPKISSRQYNKTFGRVLRFVFGLLSRNPKFHYPLSETVIFIP